MSGSVRGAVRGSSRFGSNSSAKVIDTTPAMNFREQCPKGHDNASPYTRDSKGRCRECGRERARASDLAAGHLPRALYCRNSHLRTPENSSPSGCLLCRRESKRRGRERRSPDPLGLTQRNEANRFRLEAARRRKEVKPRNWSAASLAKREHQDRSVKQSDSGPFIKWLDGWLAAHPETTVKVLSRRAGSSPRSVWSWRNGQVPEIMLSVVDRFLIAAGEPAAILDQLYPLTRHA